MFKNPFSFDGRIRRTEYCISFILMLIFRLLMEVFAEANEPAILVVLLVLLIPMMWFTLAQGAKRCHDLGKSGWWVIVPFYGFWLLFADGEQGLNEYGASPKHASDGMSAS
ncbi:DUF805 domain-containing protein [Cesiribacter sp. SM1]|uniref:DUF805 domain-containing protein n=1 Tax=Cesiribacter sp. SM1 TaxID=2861196 RepID=UPI001CD51440|nr:DUF805 domain-containing protein [Cesiribacter sp. SM1]